MRIGVYLGDMSPEEGGGFTFQDEIRRELLAARLSSRHSFVLFSNLRPESAAIQEKRGAERAWAPGQKTLRRRRGFDVAIGSLAFVRESLGIRGSVDRCMRKEGIDLAWFVTPVHCELDIPYFATVWDLQHRRQPWFPEVSERGRWRYREESLSRSLGRAAKVLVPNETGKEEVTHFYRVHPANVLALPHPTPGFALDAPPADPTPALDRLGLQPRSFYFYPSQFWPHKNHATLLAALARVRDHHGVKVGLVLTGADKGNRAHVERLVATYGLHDQVRLPGFVTREELIALYRGAVALVYPSLFGPENLPPLEAFALGCPVIAARVAGADEQLGDAAILVRPTDEVDFAAAMFSVHTDAEVRSRLVERGLARAATWTTEHYLRAVNELCDEFEAVRRCWPAGR